MGKLENYTNVINSSVKFLNVIVQSFTLKNNNGITLIY